MYTKNQWALFNPELPEEEQPEAFITLEKLNNIETGIEEAHKLAQSAGGEGTVSLAIGTVTSGETASAEIVEGKLNLVLPKGEAGIDGKDGEPGADGIDGKDGKDGEPGVDGIDGKDGKDGEPGVDGKDGYTPIKGTDYFTDEDKNEMVEAVLNTIKTVPYFDEEANSVAACGMHIYVEKAEEEGKLKIRWNASDNYEGDSIIVPEGIKIFGGGISSGRPVYYPAASVTVNSGYIDIVSGGCFGNGIVGHATVIINGGTFKQAITGGGMHWGVKNAHDNKVGHAEVIINNTENEVVTVYGGNSSGVCSTGTAKVTINGGSIQYLTLGGSNGYTGYGEGIINGGTIKVAQGCNRGEMGNIKFTVNGGTIDKLYAGGEIDPTVTAKYIKSELAINGGTINTLSAGTNGAVETADTVSGTYIDGVVEDSVAEAINLVKTYSIEQLMSKIAVLETN